jgi:hypothetical protein
MDHHQWRLTMSYVRRIITSLPRPSKRKLVRLNRTKRPLVGMIQRHRNDIELTFSNLTSCGGGLGPLPSFVRRLPRVTRWVGAKIALYHTRLRLRKLAEKK